MPPGTLNFEIPESVVIRKPAETATFISAFKELCCRITLDQYTSGLPSFAFLKRLDLDALKIDGELLRTILTDTTDRAFIRSVIDIAHTLDLKVVAQQIENEDALTLVHELGADYAQGFCVHRPEPLSNLLPTNNKPTTKTRHSDPAQEKRKSA